MLIKYCTIRILSLALLFLFSGHILAETQAEATDAPAPAETANTASASCQLPKSSPLIEAARDRLATGTNSASFWNDHRNLTSLMYEISELYLDGLNPEHYSFSQIDQLLSKTLDGEALTDCDAGIINQAYIAALKDLHFGRVEPAEHELFWYANTPSKTAREHTLLRMAKLGVKQNIHQAFNAARPTLLAYQNLRNAYENSLVGSPQSSTRIPGNALLRLGDASAIVPFIRHRLAEGGYLAAPGRNSSVFTLELSNAVRKFQRDHSLKEDALVGPNTIAEMNVQPPARINQIKVNLERLRWFSQDIEASMVLVDIAGGKISYTQENKQRSMAKIQAGKAKRQTPPLKSSISHVTLNPTWTVPPTILKKDVLPAIRKDINYLSKHRMRVFDYSWNELDPEIIDWNNPGAMYIRQDGGPFATLGKVAIRFRNPFQVYLHDTPNKRLFESNKRFYSSGCVRVENAVALTELMFETTPETLPEQFDLSTSLDKPINVTLPARTPLLMVYWTAAVEEDGSLRYRPDIYERDSKLLALLEQP